MAKENVYGFQSADVARKLSAFASQLGVSKTGSTNQGFSTGGFTVLFGEATSTITAASGDNLGSGTVKVETWDVNATTVTRSQPSDAQSLTVYNTEESSIASGTPVLVFKVASSLIVMEMPGSFGAGYGTLSSALATTDATASITLDASSPINPGGSITATNWCDQSGESGNRVVVVKEGSEWVIVNIEPAAGVGKGTLTSALATTDTTIGVSLDINSAVGSGTITANNFCGFSADNGAKCYVSTDGTTWELIQVACPA